MNKFGAKDTNKVELSFPRLEEEDNYIPKDKGKELFQKFSASIEDITQWFYQYNVDTIELWISGVIQTGSVTKLLVSAKGEGGLKVVLKPKIQ